MTVKQYAARGVDAGRRAGLDIQGGRKYFLRMAGQAPAAYAHHRFLQLRANPKNRYLFETTRCMPFTTRRVQQIVKQYRDEAGIAQHVHPRLFRHQVITYLTARGLSDSQIQLISGPESAKSLEVYRHLSLKNVEQAYQEAVKTLEV